MLMTQSDSWIGVRLFSRRSRNDLGAAPTRGSTVKYPRVWPRPTGVTLCLVANRAAADIKPRSVVCTSGMLPRAARNICRLPRRSVTYDELRRGASMSSRFGDVERQAGAAIRSSRTTCVRARAPENAL